MNQRRFRGSAEFRIENRFEQFVFDVDQLNRLLGQFFADGGHPSHRFADEAHTLPSENMFVFQVQSDMLREVIASDNRFDAGQSQCPPDVDRFDQGMRMRAALDTGVQKFSAAANTPSTMRT